jgi:P-type Ca2+ transporter type 2C
MKTWHSQALSSIFQSLKTSPNGLSSNQAAKIQEEHGLNELPPKKKESLVKVVVKQINNLMNYVLIAAAFFSMVTSHWVDFWVIILILVVNVAIGLYHHLKARTMVDSLADSFKAETIVVRDGKTKKIEIRELVPGDIVYIKNGDRFPADIRFIETHDVSAVESSLTGESKAVIKHTGEVPEDAPLAERSNMGYAGTVQVSGEAHGLVVATGTETEIGSIATSISLIKEKKTLFERRTDLLVKQMVTITFTVSGLIFVLGWLRNMPLEDLILFVLATLISGIPEALPTILIVVLSVAALRMSKRRALLKRLAAIESLSTVTTIITDKTGTLTENTMSVKTVILPDLTKIDVTGTTWEPVGGFLLHHQNTDGSATKKPFDVSDNEQFMTLAEFAGFNDQADVFLDDSDHWENIGDPTEASRVVFSRKAGIKPDEQAKRFTILHSIPYDQDTKYRQNIVRNNETKEVFLVLVGGAEKIVERATAAKSKIDTFQDIVTNFAGKAFRMQAVAYTPLELSETQQAGLESNSISTKELLQLPTMQQKVTLLGILAIQDPIRADVPDAVKKALKAGVRVIMATGDHPATARAIGIETGILTDPNNEVLTDQDVTKLSDAQLLEKLKTVTVFARMTPGSKLRIATLLQHQGEVIAMTGDGTNDAPALKKADVGISMGRIGTDAAREASDLIILDDNFATILAAIEEGRTVFRNVRQTSLFLLTTNFAEGMAMLVTMALGFALPLLPLQLLWLNLVTDGISGIALATERPQRTTLESPPRKKTDGVLSKKNLIFILTIASIMTGGTIGIFWWYMGTDLDFARTAAFVFLVFTNLFNMINLRSLDLPISEIGFFSNRGVTFSFALSCFLVGVILFVPFLREIFSFSYISPLMIGVLFVLSSVIFFAGELLKKAHTID